MESKLANLFRYANSGAALGQVGAYDINRREFSELELEKMRAENEKARDEQIRKEVACAAIEIAQQLIVELGETPEAALATANQFVLLSKDFVEKFQIPE